MKRLIALGLFGLLVLAAFGSSAAAATLLSDKPDYAPGETAILIGAGFQGGEPIDVSIAIQDPVTGEWVQDWDWMDGYCDDSGAFTAEYLVPDKALAKSLCATAMGITSGLVAKVTFTDTPSTRNVVFTAAGLPSGVTFQVDYSGTNPGGHAQNGTATFTTPNTSAAVGFAALSVLTYGTSDPFPAAVTVGTDTYNLIDVSPPSPVTLGSGGPPTPTTTITATYEKYVPPAVCPTNSAPTITASDLNLGSLVGVLAGGLFERTVPVAVDDFSPVASDPDGDPVTVTLNVDSVTLVGPGTATVEATLTATDDPSSRNVDGCPALVPMSENCTVKVTAQIVYNFIGFLSPISTTNGLQTRNVKQGATVPMQFQLLDDNGVAITDLNLPGTGLPQISVVWSSGAAPKATAAIADAGSSNDNGIYFRYAAPNWIYNLKTGATYTVGSTYKVTVSLNDGTTHDAYISITK